MGSSIEPEKSNAELFVVSSGLTTASGEGGEIKGGEKDVDEEEVGDSDGGYVS